MSKQAPWRWRLSFRYLDPYLSPGGELKGRMTSLTQHRKGTEILAPLGPAVVTSCRAIKTSTGTPS